MKKTAIALMLALPLQALAQPEVLAAAETESYQQSIRTAPAAADTSSTEPIPSDVTRLEPLVVTGTRTEHRLADSPVEVQLITQQDIRRSGASDLAELLEREGGVQVTRSAGRGAGIEIQGLSSEHVLILVDGRRMIGRINGAIDLRRLRLDAIERVEIVKGPNSALYGADALGGVVNLITRKGDRNPEAAVTVRGDVDGNGEVFGHAGWASGPLSGHLGGGYFHSEAFDLDDSVLGNDGPDADNRNLSGDLRWELSERARIDFSGAYSLDDSRRIDAGIGTASFDTRKRLEEVRVGLSPEFDLGDSTRLRFDGYYNRFFDQFLQTRRGDGVVSLDEETLDELLVGGAQLDHRIGDHRLTFGGEWQFEQLDADRLDTNAERDRQSVFVQDEFTLGAERRLVVVPGLRYDRDSQFGDQWSPKLSLRYDVANDWVLRAGYGRGYRAPDFKQLLLRFSNPAVGYRVDGNPDLEAERSTGFNAGVSWLPAGSTEISLSAYHNKVSELIEIMQIETGPPIVFSYRNVAAATLTGVDLQSRFRPWQPLEVRLGYSWLRARNDDTGMALSGRARHRVNAALRFEQQDYALNLRGVWVDQRRFEVDLDTGGVPTAAGEADAYALFDLRAEWLRWSAWTLAVGVENLLDEGDSHYLPIQPRTAYLELGWRWP